MYIYNLLTNGTGAFCREGLLNVTAFIIVLLLTVMLHEIAHGLMALAFGDRTAKEEGRLTLNPAKHFDPYGFLAMILVGFGWAKPVRVNVNNFRKVRLGMIFVSLAGVLMNFFIAFVGSLLYYLVVSTTGGITMYANSYYLWHFLMKFTQLMVTLNISFALFNILPLFPLDGYRLLSCFIPQQNGFMTFLRRYSLYILLGLLILNYIPVVSNYSPLNLWIGTVGNKIVNAFFSLWKLLF